MGYMQPDMGMGGQAPQGGGQIDIDTLIQMLMQILMTPPEGPTGQMAGGTVPVGPPSFAETDNPQAAGIMQMLQSLQMAQSQSPQQAMNATSGQMGAMGGHLGGRPFGS